MEGDHFQTSNREPVNGQPNSVPGLDTTARPATTHRSASARPVAAAVWLFAAGTLAWLVIAGDTNSALHAAPWLALLSWFIYVSQWRPCLRIDGSGFEIINGLRNHQIPFGAVRDIEVRLTTVIWAGGRKYVCWGAPTPPTAFGSGFQHQVSLKSRPFAALPSNERLSQAERPTGRDAIVAAWQNAAPPDSPLPIKMLPLHGTVASSSSEFSRFYRCSPQYWSKRGHQQVLGARNAPPQAISKPLKYETSHHLTDHND
jgi:hypothetical protein